jgi:hypothetical protein
VRITEVNVSTPLARELSACCHLNLVGGRSQKYAAAASDTVVVVEANNTVLQRVVEMRVPRTAEVMGVPGNWNPEGGNLYATRKLQSESAGDFSTV